VNFSTSGFRENLFWWATAVVTVSVQSVRISVDGNFGPRDHLKRCKRPADHIFEGKKYGMYWNICMSKFLGDHIVYGITLNPL